MDSKPFWKSKTFWLNVLALLEQLVGVIPLDPSTKVVGLGVANIALRGVTDKPVTLLK